MIVVDASAAVAGLLAAGPARQALGAEQLHAPHLVDSEVASVVRRHTLAGQLGERDGWRVLDTWRRMGMTRYPVVGLLPRIWELRDNLSAYDAAYVALAENLDCTLLTTDGRLARAHGIGCPVTVVPR